MKSPPHPRGTCGPAQYRTSQCSLYSSQSCPRFLHRLLSYSCCSEASGEEEAGEAHRPYENWRAAAIRLAATDCARRAAAESSTSAYCCLGSCCCSKALVVV